ncbi:DUF927 domain-containing protein [Stenoxybacter acetivorans]|uniref:DUF927 domain-containing protein n=1 Tax=Stenoxybacter acetivorans TaxID=422441 RepID=UPI00068D87E8|nr:DUF927 domain-containing protein [Stenoxybacter acetivorans]
MSQASQNNAVERYRVNEEGIFYLEERLCSPFQLIGRGTDDSGQHYRVITYTEHISGKKQTLPIANADIGSIALWARLQGAGIDIAANRKKRERLADYLQTGGKKHFWRVCNRAGWVDKGKAYILPNGEILQADNSNVQVIYNGGNRNYAAYQASGCLHDWQNHIAHYAQDNSRLCLALGVAFAAPLMRLLDIEGGGFHLFGDSSDGKTTTGKVALSVWGKPEELKLSWEGTGHGFANAANACNDGLMLLDEIGQASPRVVSHTAYSVINGKGKVQGAKEGGNREINHWRVMVLSTGEKTLEGYLRANNGDWQAGQANRLPSVPANAGKGYGVYDVLHGFADGALLSEHLNHVSGQYYGTAGRAFIAALAADNNALDKVHEHMRTFREALPVLSGQARRVAERFALVSAALHLTQDYGILNFSGSLPVRKCFDDWFSREGAGKYEDRRILEQANDFMQLNGNRFMEICRLESHGAHMPNLAGYKEPALEDCDKTAYLIIPAVFRDEIAKGFDLNKVCEVLHQANWLRQSEYGRWQIQKRINNERQRFYLLIGSFCDPESEDAE